MQMPLGFIQNIGPVQLLIVVGVLILVFGPKKLPDFARSLGRSLGEFKKGKAEGDRLADEKINDMLKEGDKDKTDDADKA